VPCARLLTAPGVSFAVNVCFCSAEALEGSEEDELSRSSHASAPQKAIPRRPRAAHSTKRDAAAAETVTQLIFEAS